ncbi:MAG TPA: transglycosylase SLT domain-containing protein [Frankiaceae bacterium]|jgi:hypothetical protein|nr:transglycosylase SLT domain-containing protein [Frankiaceae bacterium]
MRRSALVVALAAALVGAPAVPAYAAPENCTEEVRAVRGTQPTLAQVDGWLAAAATEHGVPVSILRVIAYKESTWRQFAADGSPLISSDGVCGVGIMQVTADGRADAVLLASDGEYNVRAGAAILKQKWAVSQETAPPNGYAADDPDVVENWYYAICLYNGCPGNTDDSYVVDAAKYLHDPFRYLPPVTAFRTYLRPAGFTKPVDVKPAYVFPGAFQARWTASGGEFVFYDHTTGTVTDVVPARVHRASAPPVVAYPAHSLGVDGPDVSCVQCGGWRLWEGAGLSGRAHWTNSITGSTPLSKATWAFGVSGRYRVDAYVPALGGETLGNARYTLSDGATVTTVTLGQDVAKGGWVTLGARAFNGPASVTLGDTSDVAGKKLVADAVRLVPEPILTLQRVTPETATYGNQVRLYLTLRYANGEGLAYRYVALYRRPTGGAWQKIATLRTSDVGAAGTVLTAERNVEYSATYTPGSGEYLAAASSPIVRQYVTPRIRAAVSPSTTRVSGDATTLNASVAPAHAGHAVQFQRWVSGTGWRTVAYGRLDTYGRAAWAFRPSYGGACGTSQGQRYRVYKPADHDHVAGASAPVDIVVRARC